MNLWLQDLRVAFRMLRKNVVLTVVIVASLAIGIGANSAIFSVVDALLLRPLPYPQPGPPGGRLAAFSRNRHSPRLAVARPVHRHPEREPFVRADGHRAEPHLHLDGPRAAGAGRRACAAQSSLLRMLGAKPLLGRLLLPEEDKPGKPVVAILSERVWQRLFSCGSRDRRQEHHAQRKSVHSWPACCSAASCSTRK